jgi:ABC-type bacteriocin/lantibiotic exporter with double-glycine peptidase domain
MVLEHLGISVAYNRLLRLLGVKPYGTPGSRLRNLTDLGVGVRYTQGSMQELFEHLAGGRPCVVLVRTGQLPYWAYATDHAVVVVGFDDRLVHVNDPAFEQFPQSVSHADFELAWMDFDYRCAVILR